MSLANITHKLSRAEMKMIMAGSGNGVGFCKKYAASCDPQGMKCCEGTCNNTHTAGYVCTWSV